MPPTLTFVVVDFHAESRFLLVRTLQRKFPGAVIHEPETADEAIEHALAMQRGAIITHRTFDVEGIDLVRLLRESNPTVPIIMVSGVDREANALAAGADAFLRYDNWLRIGSVVDEHLDALTRRDATRRQSAHPLPADAQSN